MSNIYVTLDYEVFFGTETGSVDNCMIKPTERLIDIVKDYDIRLVLFVDAGFLLALKKQMKYVGKLNDDYVKITDQLTRLTDLGHDIQLHIHPHWEDSYYDVEKNKWQIKLDRYKLSDFNRQDAEDIVGRYKQELETISGKEVFAYRAGGWCIQPFEVIGQALKKHDVWLDSTVFYKGFSESEAHHYNFKDAPDKTEWRFDNDPVRETAGGFFTEIPIFSYKVYPLFFLKLVFNKLMGKALHKPFGDGKAIMQHKSWIIGRFINSSYSVVSIDGYKASYLSRAFAAFQKRSDKRHFVIIGHPKAFSEYSLSMFSLFLKRYQHKASFLTFRDAYAKTSKTEYQ